MELAQFNIQRLKHQKSDLVLYMRSKIEAEDWHAVADAAMDIRELEAKIEVYRALEVIEGQERRNAS